MAVAAWPSTGQPRPPRSGVSSLRASRLVRAGRRDPRPRLAYVLPPRGLRSRRGVAEVLLPVEPRWLASRCGRGPAAFAPELVSGFASRRRSPCCRGAGSTASSGLDRGSRGRRFAPPLGARGALFEHPSSFPAGGIGPPTLPRHTRNRTTEKGKPVVETGAQSQRSLLQRRLDRQVIAGEVCVVDKIHTAAVPPFTGTPPYAVCQSADGFSAHRASRRDPRDRRSVRDRDPAVHHPAGQGAGCAGQGDAVRSAMTSAETIATDYSGSYEEVSAENAPMRPSRPFTSSQAARQRYLLPVTASDDSYPLTVKSGRRMRRTRRSAAIRTASSSAPTQSPVLKGRVLGRRNRRLVTKLAGRRGDWPWNWSDRAGRAEQ